MDNNYKGIYANKDDSIGYFEGGAHFRYEELYRKLEEIVKQKRKSDQLKIISVKKEPSSRNNYSNSMKKSYNPITISRNNKVLLSSLTQKSTNIGNDVSKSQIKITLSQFKHSSAINTKKKSMITYALKGKDKSGLSSSNLEKTKSATKSRNIYSNISSSNSALTNFTLLNKGTQKKISSDIFQKMKLKNEKLLTTAKTVKTDARLKCTKKSLQSKKLK